MAKDNHIIHWEKIITILFLSISMVMAVIFFPKEKDLHELTSGELIISAFFFALCMLLALNIIAKESNFRAEFPRFTLVGNILIPFFALFFIAVLPYIFQYVEYQKQKILSKDERTIKYDPNMMLTAKVGGNHDATFFEVFTDEVQIGKLDIRSVNDSLSSNNIWKNGVKSKIKIFPWFFSTSNEKVEISEGSNSIEYYFTYNEGTKEPDFTRAPDEWPFYIEIFEYKSNLTKIKLIDKESKEPIPYLYNGDKSETVSISNRNAIGFYHERSHKFYIIMVVQALHDDQNEEKIVFGDDGKAVIDADGNIVYEKVPIPYYSRFAVLEISL